MEVHDVAAERKIRKEAFGRMSFHVIIALVTGIIAGIILYAALCIHMRGSYDNYVKDFNEHQGFWFFSPPPPVQTLIEYSFFPWGFTIVAIITLVVTTWIAIVVRHFYPGPKSAELIEWEETVRKEAVRKEAERREAEREKNEWKWGKEWLTEIRLQPKAIEGNKERDRHNARLEIINYFVHQKITLEQDPFRHHSNTRSDERSFKNETDLWYYTKANSLQDQALLLFFFRAYDYGRAVLKAETIARDLVNELELLDLESTVVFKFERTPATESHSGSSVLGAILGIALFTGTAFVTYKVVKNVSNATFGRAGRLVDAATERVKPRESRG